MQGLRKPAPESFATVVDHLGLPPDRLLFVDDRQVRRHRESWCKHMRPCFLASMHLAAPLPRSESALNRCSWPVHPPVRPQANVDGALAAGIPAVRFESAAQLEKELLQRGFRL